MTQRLLNANAARIYDQEMDKFGRGFEYLGGAELLTANAVIGSVFIDPRSLLIITGRVVSTSLTGILALRFNDDEGTNYWHRNMSAGLGSATFSNTGTPSATMLNLSRLTGTLGRTFFAVVMNSPGKTHPCAHNQYEVTGAAATVGELEFGGGEWASTDTIINVQLRNTGTGTFAADSGFAVFGKDV